MKLASGLVLLSLAACAPSARTPARTAVPPAGDARAPHARVEEHDLARVPPAHFGIVAAARDELFAAADERMRAEQRASLSSREITVAEERADAARAQIHVGGAELALARDTGDRARIAAVQESLVQANLALFAATARVDLARVEKDGRLLEVELAKQREAFARAKFEAAKLESLRASGDASADRYPIASFDAAIARTNAAVERAAAALEKHAAKVREASDRVRRAEAEIERKNVKGQE